MKQRIQVLALKRHKHEVENSSAGVEQTHIKQRIQVLAWNRHKHETEKSGAGVDKTQT
jgi:hypothetical protein